MRQSLNRYELGEISNQTKENQEAIDNIIEEIKTIKEPVEEAFYVVLKIEGCPTTFSIDSCKINRIGDIFHFCSNEKTLVVPVEKIVYFWKNKIGK